MITLLKQHMKWWPQTFAQYCILFFQIHFNNEIMFSEAVHTNTFIV